MPPVGLILTPGNTADCTVGPACVSLLDGIAELLGDKAYDSNSFRKSLRKDGIKPVIPGRSNRKNAYVTTSKPTRIATSSSAATAGSRTSGASQRATTNSLGTASQPCASLPPWHSGFSRARFPLLGQHGERVGTRMTTGNHEGEVGMSSQRVSGTAAQRTIAVLGSAVFFVVAPFTLAGLVPWSITGWQLRPPFLGLELRAASAR